MNGREANDGVLQRRKISRRPHWMIPLLLLVFLVAGCSATSYVPSGPSATVAESGTLTTAVTPTTNASASDTTTTTLMATTSISTTTTSAATTTTTEAVVTPGTLVYEITEWTADTEGWARVGQWKSVHGMLVSDGTQPSISIAPVNLGSMTDYAVEAEMQVIDPSKGSFYLEARLISGEGYWGGYEGGYYQSDCSVRVGFASEMLSSVKYVDDGNWHTYRLEVYGNSIRLLFDGAEVVRATDNRQLEAGTVGIYASGQMNVRAFRVIAL